MNRLPVITRLNTSIERREHAEARARGARVLALYAVIVLAAVWWVLGR